MDKKVLTVLKTGLTLASMAVLATASFTPETKREVKNNPNETNRLEPSYEPFPDERMEVMHIDHTKDRNYNNPKRAVYVTITQHLAYHLLYQECPSDIGLTRLQNDWTIKTLRSECLRYYREKGLDFSDLLRNVNQEKYSWISYIRTYILGVEA